MQWDKLKAKRIEILRWASIYIWIHTLLYFIYKWISIKLLSEETSPLPDHILPLFDTGNELILIAGISALQAVVFARLGAMLDYPIWRCRSDQEAIQRFFLLWFIVNLILAGLTRIASSLDHYGFSDLGVLVGILGLVANVLYFPMTVCWMHSGEKRTEDEEWTRVFRPLTRQFSDSLGMWVIIVVSLLGVLYIYELPSMQEDSEFAIVVSTALMIPMAGVDIVVFCWTWILCIQYRDLGLDDELDWDEF